MTEVRKWRDTKYRLECAAQDVERLFKLASGTWPDHESYAAACASLATAASVAAKLALKLKRLEEKLP